MKHIALAVVIMFGGTSVMAEMPGNGNGPPPFGGSNTNIQGQAQGQLQGQLQGQAQGQQQTARARQSQSMSGGNVSVNDRLQAPALAAPSMSSGHPCAYGAASFGLSLVGGASTFASSQIDDACLLAQMGYKSAAMVMIAQRNGAAQDALRRTGYIADPAPTTSTRSSAPERPAVAYTSCKMDEGAIRVGVRRGADDATRSLAVSQCTAKLK